MSATLKVSEIASHVRPGRDLHPFVVALGTSLHPTGSSL
jgi:hypothetical protein